MEHKACSNSIHGNALSQPLYINNPKLWETSESSNQMTCKFLPDILKLVIKLKIWNKGFI